MNKRYKRLKELRVEFGLTQKEAAEIIGSSVSAYRRKEQGTTVLYAFEVYQLSLFYDVPVDYIVELTDCRTCHSSKPAISVIPAQKG